MLLVRDLMALAGGEVVSKIVGFAAFAYLARTLGPEAYGPVELAVSLAVFFTLIVDFGMGPIATREIARDRSRAPALAAQVPGLRLLLAFVAIPAMGGVGWATGQTAETVHLVWLFSLGLLAAPWIQAWLFQGLEMMPWVSGGQAIRMLAFALGVVVLVKGPEDLMRVGYVEIGAAACTALYFVTIQVRRVAPLGLAFDGGRELLLEGMALGLGKVVWALNQYLSIVLIAFFMEASDIALFGAANRIVMSLAAFAFLYHFNLFPMMSRSFHASRDAREGFLALVRPSFRVTSWTGIGVGLVGSFAATPVCRLIFGEPFAAAGAPLAVLVWTLPAILISGHARHGLIAAGHQRYILVAQSGGALFTVLLGTALIARYGMMGAAISSVACFFVVWWLAQRHANRVIAPLPFWDVLLRPVLGALLATAACFASGASGWWAVLVSGGVFAASALLFDRRLPADIRTLAHAKGSAV